MSQTSSSAWSPSRRTLKRAIIFSGKLALVIGIFYWLVQSGRFDFATFGKLFAQADLWLLVSIFVLQLSAFTIVVFRWLVLARAVSVPVSLRDTMLTGYQGLASSLVLPGSLGLDGIRLLHVRKNYPEQLLSGVSSVLMDRVAGLVGLLLLAILASTAYVIVSGNSGLNTVLAISSVLLLTALVGLAVICIILPRGNFALTRRYKTLASLLDALELYTRQKTALLLSILLAAIGHLFTCAAWLVALRILGIDLQVLGVVAVTAVLNVLRTIPITPLGLGVTDSAAEEMYALIGISAGAELQMLIRLVTMLAFMTCALAFFWHTGGANEQDAPIVSKQIQEGRH